MGSVQEQLQHEGHAPLLEPAVLVSENCPDCRGTGFKVVTGLAAETPWAKQDRDAQDVPRSTTPCGRCEGAGREVREVPLSELMQLLSQSQEQARQAARVASPSELRGGS